MKIIPIKTRIIKLPKDDIFDIFDNLKIKNSDVIIVTSKIISIHQGRCIPIDSVKSKDDLIIKEADYFIPRKDVPGNATMLTIKNSNLIASAGIDENKNAGYYILLPDKPEKIAKEICLYLKKKFSLKKLAVIITDSHTIPLKFGVIGFSIGFFGLEPFKKYFDKNGEEIVSSRVNIIDSLAAAAVLEMGEQSEQTPLAIIKNTPNIKFTDKETFQQTVMAFEKDIYYPVLKNFKEDI
jgi:F420-0:gamma-glutamyl ligase